MQRARRALTILLILGILLTGLTWQIVMTVKQNRLDRQLVAAVRSSDVVSVESLLNRGANPNAREVPEFTGIRLEDLWKALLHQSRTSNESRYSPILIQAVELSNLSMVRTLLEHGASPNARDSAGATALMDAIFDGSSEIANTLIDHGADVAALDRFRDTPLMWASYWAEDSVVKYLIARHANVNAHNAANWTPLMFAASSDGTDPAIVFPMRNLNQLPHTSIVMPSPTPAQGPFDITLTTRLLISAGADINAKDHIGNTVLIRAYCLGHPQVTGMLIDAGADVNQPIMTTYIENPGFFTQRGYFAVGGNMPRRTNGEEIQVGWDLNRNATLLMLAALCEDRAMIRTLLAHGAALTKTNSCGRTAFFYARSHPYILRLLRQALIQSKSYSSSLSDTQKVRRHAFPDFFDPAPPPIPFH